MTVGVTLLKSVQLMEVEPHRPQLTPCQALPQLSQPSFPAAEASTLYLRLSHTGLTHGQPQGHLCQYDLLKSTFLDWSPCR